MSSVKSLTFLELKMYDRSHQGVFMQRRVIIAGNWKMYKTNDEAVQFVKELEPLVQDSIPAVYLAVPFTAIQAVSEAAKGSQLVVGGQNMNNALEGAFTGEISARMLLQAGARFVILGHSERRIYFNESNDFINKKLNRALKDGLQPILCVGESLEEREQGKTEEVLKKQLTECMASVPANAEFVLAYEPVWAIGTNQVASPEEAQKVHAFCRQVLRELWGDMADQIRIIYGGSVKPDNAAELLEQPDVDGLLVGGASLKIESFSQIVNYQKVSKT